MDPLAVKDVIAALLEDPRSNPAWERLSQLIWPVVVTACCHYGLSESVEDTHAAVLGNISLHTRLESFESGEGFEPYVWTVVRKLAIRDWKKSKARTDDQDNGQAAAPGSPLDACMFEELARHVSKSLPIKDLELLDLIMNGGTNVDHAAILGISVRTYAVRVNRLKQRILDLLEKN